MIEQFEDKNNLDEQIINCLTDEILEKLRLRKCKHCNGYK